MGDTSRINFNDLRIKPKKSEKTKIVRSRTPEPAPVKQRTRSLSGSKQNAQRRQLSRKILEGPMPRLDIAPEDEAWLEPKININIRADLQNHC